MKSTASINTHPIHPMLIPFPFAFLTGAWGFRVAAAFSENDDLKTVSRYLVPAGLVAGLVAAVPGSSITSAAFRRKAPPRSVRPNTRSSTSGRWHCSHCHGSRTASAIARCRWRSKTAGTATLCVAAWMGGTLAYRNQIGVDHRYANAGKWQEDRGETDDAGALESAAHGLGVNQMKLLHVGQKRVAIGRTGKGYVAFQDRCTHKGGPLSDGVLMCGTVQCPWHGSQFDVQTGEVKSGPAEVKIETYDVHEHKKIGA
jgi:nitrite reductase/ring-hydroxylating ferredoxin subunit/uncharacterized membrane protein